MTQRKAPAPTLVTTLHPRNKLFVLDTNVLMHDPTSLFRFEEHDVYLPMVTLEELDSNKKGMSEVARNARQASRFLDEIVSKAVEDIAAGIPLGTSGAKEATGRLFLQTESISGELPARLAAGKGGQPDHRRRQAPAGEPGQTTGHSGQQRHQHAHQGACLGFAAEDYFNDKVLEDTDLLYTGVRELPPDFWDQHGKEMESWQQDGRTYYRVRGPLCDSLMVNEFVFLESEKPFYAQVREQSGKTAILQTIRDYTHQKNNIWGIVARNREQNFALNLLMNPERGLRDPARTGRHRQNADDARGRPDADAGGQGLFRNHHDPRHGPGRRRHRIPARHGGGKNDSVDGGAR
jgi:PhoH-like ATPase